MPQGCYSYAVSSLLKNYKLILDFLNVRAII